MNATRVGIISMPANGRATRSVPTRSFVRLRQLKLGRFNLSKDATAALQKPGTFRSERDAARAAMEKAHAEPFLHPRYRLADR